MVKAIYIDSVHRSVVEVEIDSSQHQFRDLQRLVRGYIENAQVEPLEHTMYVDEEGLLKGRQQGFVVLGRRFVGNGVVVGETATGGWHGSVSCTAAQIEEIIEWT